MRAYNVLVLMSMGTALAACHPAAISNEPAANVSFDGVWQEVSFGGHDRSGYYGLIIRDGHVRMQGCGEFGGHLTGYSAAPSIEINDLGRACDQQMLSEHNELFGLLASHSTLALRGSQLRIAGASGNYADYASARDLTKDSK